MVFNGGRQAVFMAVRLECSLLRVFFHTFVGILIALLTELVLFGCLIFTCLLELFYFDPEAQLT